MIRRLMMLATILILVKAFHKIQNQKLEAREMRAFLCLKLVNNVSEGKWLRKRFM